MTWARMAALAGSLCLHGALLALVLRDPGWGGAGPDPGGNENGVFSVETASEPTPVAPVAAASLPNVVEALPVPQEPAWEPEMVWPLDIGMRGSVAAAQEEHRVVATEGGRMGKSVGKGNGKGGGGGGGGTYVPPSYLYNPVPAYPLKARLSGREGMVMLEVVVNEVGRAAEVEVLRSSGDRELDGAAVATVRRWTFHPGMAGGKAVTARVEVPVRFRLK